MPTVTIDNQSVEIAAGATVLDAAVQLGIEIPTLCHLPGREARGSCLLCVVKVQGPQNKPRLVPACATAATEGMRVENDTEEVRNARRTAIELLLSDHLGDCIGPCQSICPAHLNTPLMMRQIAAGQFRQALITVKQSIALPAILGRICPEICEKGCRRATADGPVSVCLLKRFVADEDLATGQPYIPPCQPPSGRQVAIIGSGPAGLSAAYYLLQQGHACTIFDDHGQPGGLLRYGIAEDMLPREILDAEAGIIFQMGATFQGNTRIGTDISLQELRDKYDAVLIAVGSIKAAQTEGDLAANQSTLIEGFLDGIERGPHGLKVHKSTLETNLPGIFAAGSVVLSSHHAVRAVANGRLAADAIHRFLTNKVMAAHEHEFTYHIGKLSVEQVQPYLQQANLEGRHTPAGGQITGFTAEEAQREAARCLHCDCAQAGDCKLRELAMQYKARSHHFRDELPDYAIDTGHPEVLFERGKCIACGICVTIAAEAGEEFGLNLQGRGFTLRPATPGGVSLADALRRSAQACATACPTGALVLRSKYESPH